jgi:membrane protein implicated in regulation of membrane protease activity
MAEERKSTLWSGIGMLLVILGLVALAVFLILNPDILLSIGYVLIVLALVIVAVAVIAILAMSLLAIPFYISRGESRQTDMSYDLSDIKPVKEKLDPDDDGDDGR